MSKGSLLTQIQGLEVKILEVERAFAKDFPRANVPDHLYNSRSYPGGAFQTMHQDLQRLRQKIHEEHRG